MILELKENFTELKLKELLEQLDEATFLSIVENVICHN